MPTNLSATAPLKTAIHIRPLENEPEMEAFADCRGKRIGVLIVAYNAVTTLALVLKRIQPQVWRNVEEVVVFDDASQDATYELAIGYKVLSEASKLHVIKNRKNLGYGGNQKAGYQYFLDRGFDVVVLLHGDGQYAPEMLAHLYHPIVGGTADAVFGSRMLPDYGGPREGGMPLYKYLGNRILTSFENRALRMNLSEFHSGYRAYSMQALSRIDFSKMTDDFHFDTEIIIKLNHQGFKIREVPIPTYYGDEICYVNGMKYAWDVAKAVYRYKRTAQSASRFPEFEEYFVQYHQKESKHSSHYYARQFVGTGQDVLDCGCGPGFIASDLAGQGNHVIGIDTLPASQLRIEFSEYIRADLKNGLDNAVEALRGRTFDWVLLMDILEHLEDPTKLLCDCKRVLKPNGRLFISLPNIANITIRTMLLMGRFEYTQQGILDRTHLRFFTRQSAKQLIEGSGYKILLEQAAVIPLERALGLPPTNILMQLCNRVLKVLTRLRPNLFAYQNVFVVAADNESTA